MKGIRFLFLAILLGAIDILVPYLWLAPEARFTGSFLFWCLMTLVVIVAAGIYTRTWGAKR